MKKHDIVSCDTVRCVSTSSLFIVSVQERGRTSSAAQLGDRQRAVRCRGFKMKNRTVLQYSGTPALAAAHAHARSTVGLKSDTYSIYECVLFPTVCQDALKIVGQPFGRVSIL